MTKRTMLMALVGCALFGGACSKTSNDAHYAAVESNREAQAAQPGAPAASPSPSPSASAPPSPGASPVAAAASNYWTNFRGPKRDGRYDETTVSTNWPSSGLKQIWKQPVGVGHASFVVADGKAYTIEQRRGQEVGAAYA